MKNNDCNDPRWQSLPVRHDRSPNQLNDVAQLWLTRSDPYHPMNQSTPTFFKTEFGNINGDGNPSSFSSPIMGIKNAHLDSALEPRISPLVSLINIFGFVTYSSCEGHLIQASFYEAYAGFLYESTKQAHTTTLIHFATDSGFQVFRTWLVDSIDGTKYATVEVYFPCVRRMRLEDYHDELKRATNRLAISLSPHDH